MSKWLRTVYRRIRARLDNPRSAKLAGSSMLRRVLEAPSLVIKPGLAPGDGPPSLPDFVIVGSTRCGSTSMYEYLVRHPCIAPAVRKEVHFFDNHYGKGLAWYRSQFPSLVYGKALFSSLNRVFVTGESTPYYLYHPHAAARMASVLPGAKLIALLRDPVDRAYGDYINKVARGFEGLDFEQALDAEQERMKGEIEKMAEDNAYYSFTHQHNTYLSKGIYVDQLTRWLRYFSREQLCILRSEDLYADPLAVTRQVTNFLELPEWSPNCRKVFHQRRYQPMAKATRRRLVEYYAPHNERLYQLLDTDLGWQK